MQGVLIIAVSSTTRERSFPSMRKLIYCLGRTVEHVCHEKKRTFAHRKLCLKLNLFRRFRNEKSLQTIPLRMELSYEINVGDA